MRTKNILIMSVVTLLICYLLGHLFYGSKSIVSLFTLSSKKQRLIIENKLLEKDKEKLEQKVKRMKSDSLDIDTLDEQARKNLGYSKEKEIIYVE